MLDPNRPLFIATNRFVCALNPTSGRELWRTRFPGTGMIVTLLFSDGWLYAGCGGNVYGINPADGAILWNNGLPGTGYQAVILTREGANSDQEAAIAAEIAARAAAAASAAAASSS
jgi:outer membrane protein assembly factor BamB